MSTKTTPGTPRSTLRWELGWGDHPEYGFWGWLPELDSLLRDLCEGDSSLFMWARQCVVRRELNQARALVLVSRLSENSCVPLDNLSLNQGRSGTQ
jgi:hypothetical protein